MTTGQQAHDIAEKFLAGEQQPRSAEELVVTGIEEFPHCWLATYNTRLYAETGDIRHSLVGNGPLIINRHTGLIRQGTSAYPMEEQLDHE
jgi:hypothetical protein